MDRSKPPPATRKSALEALYATFNRYDGIHLEGCPHCISFEDSAALRRAPVRRLGGELYRYLFKAMTTWGTEEDFKHFVPRLLELYASSADAWLLCDKLAYARWRSWPALERGAVESYLFSLWRERLAEDGPPLPGVALLDTMLSLGLDLAPYDLRAKLEAWRSAQSRESLRDLAPYDLRAKLDAWRSAQSRESIRSLARFVLEHGDALSWPSPPTGRPTLWQARPEIAAEVRAWLLEPATRAGLEAGFLEHGDDEVARAFDWLEVAAQEP